MPPQTATPTWWTDVQEHRDEIEQIDRRAIEWSDDDFDLVPPSVGKRRPEQMMADRVERVRTKRFERPVADEPVRAEAVQREEPITDFLSEPPRVGERRTVTITGQAAGAPRRTLMEIERRRPPRSVTERAADRPDRMAMYAAAFGFLLILIAAISTSPA
jgi:hypothetical protein